MRIHAAVVAVFLVAWTAVVGAPSAEAAPADERWAGSVELPTGGTLDFTVRVVPADAASGAVPAVHLTIPSQGVADVMCRDVAIAGRSRRFTFGEPLPQQAWALFQVAVADDGARAFGSMTQSGMNLRVAMERLKADEPARAGAAIDDGAFPGERWSGRVEIDANTGLEFTARLLAGSDGAPATGAINIPVQGIAAVALHDVSIAPDARRFTLRAGATEPTWAKFVLTPAADGRTAAGVMRQMGATYKVSARRLDAGEGEARTARPQEPKPPFPYTIREVTYRNPLSDGTLAGTLTVPEGKGPFPAAILISGSGTQDRDESLFGHKPFWVLADHLSRHGIAVLRVDDRGAGGSSAGTPTDTTHDFATDVRAGLGFLAAQPEIDAARIGLIGHSEGGLIAAMVAGAPEAKGGPAAGVAWIVLLASPGVRGREVVIDQATSLLMPLDQNGARPAGVPDAAAVAALRAAAAKAIDAAIANRPEPEVRALVRELVVAQQAASPAAAAVVDVESAVVQTTAAYRSAWFRAFLAYDPAPDVARISVPVLVLNGAKDCQVRPELNLPPLEKALRAAGNSQVTVRSLPGLNHLFQHAQSGGMEEYGLIDETFSPEALEIVTEWVRARGKAGG